MKRLFEPLEHKRYQQRYQLDLKLPGWRFTNSSDRDRNVDLTKSGCSELFLTVELLPGEIRGVVLTGQEKLDEVLRIEAIPLRSDGGLKPRTGSTQTEPF